MARLLNLFELPLLRPDVMPEDVHGSVDWCLGKLIKGMGDAKTLSVRLLAVKHQEKLCRSAACS